MPVGTSGPWIRRLAALLLGCAVTLAACGTGTGPPRPTDPRAILVGAINATAAVPTLRLHVEVSANMGQMAGQPNAVMAMAVDADVDLANRQFAGRSTTQMPRDLGGNGIAAPQVSDMIVTRDASFNRDSRTGRWSKFPTGGMGVGPTNVQIATMITNLLSNPAVTFELREAGSCTLGTCDHVVAHIDGQTLAAALGPLMGMPADAGMQAAIPDFDVDVLVDQATSVISELRTGISMQGSSTQILLTVSNPGQPVQIAPPPAALTDDFGGMEGGFGEPAAPTPIPEPAMSDGETPPPTSGVESPSLP